MKRYRFYRIIHGHKIYLFCRAADTPNPESAALYTEADWLEWGQWEGLQRDDASDDLGVPEGAEPTGQEVEAAKR